MTPVPSGTVTFLFTDIEDSTGIAQAHPAAWETLRARHNALLRNAMQAHRGHVFQAIGDGFCVAFHTADEAIHAAIASQHALQSEARSPAPVRVRIGLHTGEARASVGDGDAIDYVGYQALARAQRITAVAHGGQVVVSGSCRTLVQDALPDGVALLDLGQHRLKGFAEPERLWQVAAPSLRREFPALQSQAETPNNLPHAVTRFIGRAQELAECERLLRQTRLLTLTAIGGAGKTRLAIEVARSELDRFPDGAWFVDLASLQEGERLGLAVADALGFRPQGDTPILETIAQHLASRRALIVLDNCEHILDPVAALVESLLARCASVVFLCTSREGLGLAGEQIFTVRSLRMPAGMDLEEVKNSEAVALFMDRARLADPTLQLDAANAPIVADICRRLDGIALAIELAAARAKMLKLPDIRARLSDRFRLLTGGNRALPRQQTLLATLHWSYDQLTAGEQALLQRLGIFVGGWSLPAATAVSGDDADEFEVLDTLTRLADKSLIALDRDAGEESRYAMVETLRQFALDRLEDGGGLQDARARHAMFFVALITDSHAAPEAGTDTWLKRIDLDHENLLAAHAACGLHVDMAEPGLELVTAMARYWEHKGMFGLGYGLIAEALDRADAVQPTVARCEALRRLGHIEIPLGRYDQALQPLREALAIARKLDDKAQIALTLQALAGIHNARGKLQETRICLDESLEIAAKLGGRFLHGTRHMMGELLRREGDLAGAEKAYAENLANSRALGVQANICTGLINLALVAVQRDDGAGARRHLVEAMRTPLGRTDRGRRIIILELCAAAASIDLEYALAARFHGAAQTYANQMGFHPEPVDAMATDPLIDKACAEMGEAAFADACTGGAKLAWEAAGAEALAWLEAQR